MRKVKFGRAKRIIGWVCLVCLFASFSVSTTSAKWVEEKDKRELTFSQYYPETGNAEKYFEYFLIPDAFVEEYNSLYVTRFSNNYGKYLEIPDALEGKVITDIILMDVDTIEEVKLGDKALNMICVYPEKNYDGTPGKYSNAFCQHDWHATVNDMDICEEQIEQAKPQNTIKKLTVGKNFQLESLTGDWFYNSFYYDSNVVEDIYSYKTLWRLAEYTNLEEVSVPNENEYFKVDSQGVYSKGYKELVGILPGKLKEISTFTTREECTTVDASFAGAANLKEVVLGDSVTHVGIWTNPFAGCENLTSLKIGKNLEGIGSCAFSNAALEGELVFPQTLKSIGPDAFRGTKLKKVSFENCPNVSLHKNVFLECKQLEEVILPEGLKVIRHGLFRDCSLLENINWPDSIKGIHSSSFSDCVKLSAFKAPKKLQRIGPWAFKGCVALENVTLNNKLNLIETEAFDGCISIKKLTLPKKLKEVKENGFVNCSGMKQIIVKGKRTLLHAKSIGYVADENGELKVNKKLVIYGKKGSVAQNYARVNKIKFKLLK